MSIYRITRRARIERQDDGLQGDEPGGNTRKETIESYVEKAIKLIPADVVAAYLALRNVWLPLSGDGADDALGESMRHWLLPLGGLAAVIILRILGTSSKFATLKDVQWSVVGVSSIAYIAWIMSFNDPILQIETPDPRLSATLLILVSIIGPSFVKSEEAAT